MRIGSAQFVRPARWSVEEAEGGLLLLAPEQEDEWQANIFVEARTDSEDTPLDEAIDRYAESLAEHKKQFVLLDKRVEERADGVRLGRIEFTWTSNSDRLTQREFLIIFPDGKQVWALMNSTTKLWSKYRPIFAAFVDSIQIAK